MYTRNGHRPRKGTNISSTVTLGPGEYKLLQLSMNCLNISDIGAEGSVLFLSSLVLALSKRKPTSKTSNRFLGIVDLNTGLLVMPFVNIEFTFSWDDLVIEFIMIRPTRARNSKMSVSLY